MKKNTFYFFLIFAGGVICANILGIVSGRELGAVSEYFVNRCLYAEIRGQELFPYLFYERAPGFFLLLFLSVGIYGTWIADGYIAYLGFSAGFLSVISIMSFGIRGVLLMLGFFLPQWLFYAPLLAIWRQELRRYKGIGEGNAFGEQKKTRHMKLAGSAVIALVLLLAGLFAESYVNPYFLQKIIRML